MGTMPEVTRGEEVGLKKKKKERKVEQENLENMWKTGNIRRGSMI